jgi:hypothetical protein
MHMGNNHNSTPWDGTKGTRSPYAREDNATTRRFLRNPSPRLTFPLPTLDVTTNPYFPAAERHKNKLHPLLANSIPTSTPTAAAATTALHHTRSVQTHQPAIAQPSRSRHKVEEEGEEEEDNASHYMPTLAPAVPLPLLPPALYGSIAGDFWYVQCLPLVPLISSPTLGAPSIMAGVNSAVSGINE